MGKDQEKKERGREKKGRGGEGEEGRGGEEWGEKGKEGVSVHRNIFSWLPKDLSTWRHKA